MQSGGTCLCSRLVGAHRQKHDPLFGLEAEQVRDHRDQLVGVLDGECHAEQVCTTVRLPSAADSTRGQKRARYLRADVGTDAVE